MQAIHRGEMLKDYSPCLHKLAFIAGRSIATEKLDLYISKLRRNALSLSERGYLRVIGGGKPWESQRTRKPLFFV